jgi:tetratricopeptide (TPR) repeat protein
MKTAVFVVALVLSGQLGSNFVVFGQAVDPLAEGNGRFEARDYQGAAEVYQRLLKTDIDVPTRAKVWFNLGLTLQKLARYDEAVSAFGQIFELDVNDRETGGHLMEPYRNYRSRAQWEIGHSLFAKGDYRGALEAYRTTRLKYPLESWCGVEAEVAQHQYALHEGLSYEHLGLYREAVESYLRIHSRRLFELYEATGQLEDLKRMLAVRDQAYLNALAGRAGKMVSPAQFKQSRPSWLLHEMIDIHASGQSRDWPALFRLLREWSTGSGMGREQVVVSVLARYPEETVPLLKREIARGEAPPGLMYRALGLAGTPDAVATLKSFAEREENYYLVLWAVEALGTSGELGRAALEDLDKGAKNNLRIVLDQHKSGVLEERRGGVKFPPIPPKLTLPKEI